MAQAIVEELGRIAMSQNLATSLSRASGYAQAQLHREVALEHLLLALTEDPDAAQVLIASRVDVPRLNADVSAVIGRIEDRNPPEHAGQIAVSPDLRRILEAAGAAAAKGKRREINGAIVLAAIVGDGRTTAAHLLRAQGLTFEEAIRVLRAPPPPPPPLSAPSLQQLPPAPQDFEAEVPAAAMPAPMAQPATANQRRSSTEDILASARERVQRARSEAVSAAMRPAAVRLEPVAEPMAPPPEPQPEPDPGPLAYPQPDYDVPLQAHPDAAAMAAPPGSYGEPYPVEDAYPAPPPLPLAPPHLPAQTDGYEAYPVDGYPMPAATPPELPPAPHADAVSAGWGAQDIADPRSRFEPQPTQPPWGYAQQGEVHWGHGEEAPPAAVMPRRSGSLPGVARTAQQAPGYPDAGDVYGGGERAAEAAYPPWQPAEPQSYDYSAYPAPVQGYQGPAGGGRTLAPQPLPAPKAVPQARIQSSRPAERRGSQPGVDAGQLVENIPRRMRKLMPVVVEARIAKADVADLIGDLAQNGGVVYRHDLAMTKAMSVRLRAPDGGFFIETASPETQWIENTLGLMSADFASWRWTVTPRVTGRRRLQLVVAARTVGGDGLAAETALPERVIEVAVATNYALAARTWGGWVAAAILGGVISKFGQQLMDAGVKLAALWKAG